MYLSPTGKDLNLAEKYWIPAIVVDLTPEHIAQFKEEGFEFTDEMQHLMERYPLPKLDEVRFIPDTESYEEKQQAFRSIIQKLEPGLTQIMISPAIESEALKAITPRWQQLVWDEKLLNDPQTKAELKRAGVKLTNWREIMRRFDAGLRRPARRARN